MCSRCRPCCVGRSGSRGRVSTRTREGFASIGKLSLEVSFPIDQLVLGRLEGDLRLRCLECVHRRAILNLEEELA